MRLSKKDIAMYMLFFAIVIMFIFLFFIFFRNSESQYTDHAIDIPIEITDITLTGTKSDVNIYPSKNGKAYIVYGTQKSASDSDDITIATTENEMNIIVKRAQGNTLSGLWGSKETVDIYLPEKNNLTLNFNMKYGTVIVKDAITHQVNVDATACEVKIHNSSLDRLNLVSTLGALETDSAKIAISDINVSIGDFKFLHQANNNGFSLDGNLSTGIITSDKELALEHPYLAIKYTDKLSGLEGSNKISLTSNIARINFSK